MSEQLKPCPACGKILNLPSEYFNAVENIRVEVEKFGPVIIADFIENDLKYVLFELAKSHSKLAQAEYKRNPSYNNEHFSHKAEESLIEFLQRRELIDEFMKYMA